jgi:thiamine biosynthesis lipoprotein
MATTSTRRKRASFAAAIGLWILGTPLLAEEGIRSPRHREVRHVMGTQLDVTLHHDDRTEARGLLDRVFAVAQELDRLLSNYKADSELSRLNRAAGTGRIRVSSELYEFLAVARNLWRKSEGAFDISVGPLMRLWREAVERQRKPSVSSLREVKDLIGMTRVRFHAPPEVELTLAGMALDSGGIGKGYAVDRIAATLRTGGVKSALINFGQSSIYAIGAPPDSQAWRLLLRFSDERPLGVVELKDAAFAASDSFGRTFEVEGKKYGHLIDPRDGHPVTGGIQAAVIGQSATEAEALVKQLILRGLRHDLLDEWPLHDVWRRDENGITRQTKNFPLRSSPESRGTKP